MLWRLRRPFGVKIYVFFLIIAVNKIIDLGLLKIHQTRVVARERKAHKRKKEGWHIHVRYLF